ncbi:MAG: hypothetical protein ABIJ09_02315 [Pseudomonadota bacterium]
MIETDRRAAEGRVRNLPGWARVGSVLVRAAHLTACAAILGGQLVGGRVPGLGLWWVLAATSGVLLLAHEWASHPDLLRQLSGWVTIAKLGLLALARAVPTIATGVLLVAFFIAVLGAHLPKRWRHRILVATTSSTGTPSR